MLARTEIIVTIVEYWLTQFEQALSEPDDALLKPLFHADSHWRDVLALTWRIVTVNGADTILRKLRTHNHRVQRAGFKIPAERTAPRLAHGVQMRSGETIPADLIILATGYKGPRTSGRQVVWQ